MIDFLKNPLRIGQNIENYIPKEPPSQQKISGYFSNEYEESIWPATQTHGGEVILNRYLNNDRYELKIVEGDGSTTLYSDQDRKIHWEGRFAANGEFLHASDVNKDGIVDRIAKGKNNKFTNYLRPSPNEAAVLQNIVTKGNVRSVSSDSFVHLSLEKLNVKSFPK